MAVALQIQVTLFAKGDYLGLRVSAADMLLPFCGIFVLYSLITKKSRLPKWSVKYMIPWIIALITVMSIALLNGYINNGFLSSWAFVNKYIGFLLLLSYLALGGWLVTNTKNSAYIISLFVNIFVGFFVITMALSVALLFLQYFLPYPLLLPNYPWDGFMANRNAYMVVFVMSFIFIIWSYKNSDIKIPAWIRIVFWLSTLTFFLFNGSRTGWIVSAVLFAILLLKEPVKRSKTIIPLLLVGFTMFYASFFITTNIMVTEARQMGRLLNVIGDDVDYNGDQRRYLAVDDGLELYKKHNPLLGAGLGTYKPFQIDKRGEFIEIIDFTALWLLVETGALGLSIFAAFFAACSWSLYKTGYVEGENSYHRAMLIFLITFAAMSILHELMYTRFLWLALGLALANNKS